jgi:hypothetical protein
LTGLPEFRGSIKDLGKGVPQHSRLAAGRIAAWRLVSPGVRQRLYADKSVQLCVDVQEGILVVVRTD